jgi:flagellar hook-length control protein FliK
MAAQASRGIAAALRQGNGTAVLRLTPEALGVLKVQITLSESQVTARLEPSTESARQLLLESQQQLRAALEARGLSVERIQIDAVAEPPASGGPQAQSDGGGGEKSPPDGSAEAQGRGAAAGADEPGEPAAMPLAVIQPALWREGGMGLLRLDAVA